jgi:hypothetical protein
MIEAPRQLTGGEFSIFRESGMCILGPSDQKRQWRGSHRPAQQQQCS